MKFLVNICALLHHSWLASRHRKKPHPKVGFRLAPELAADPSLQVASGRRATSLDLPMAMRYRYIRYRYILILNIILKSDKELGMYLYLYTLMHSSSIVSV